MSRKWRETLSHNGLKFEPFHSEVGQLKMLEGSLNLGAEFESGKTFALLDFQGNKLPSMNEAEQN